MHMFRDLQQREKEGRPIEVGVIGCGFFGSGVIRQLVRTPGLRPSVIANRTPEKAVETLRRCGVDSGMITQCDEPGRAEQEIEKGRYVVTGDLGLPARIGRLEVISETTGNLEVGAETALQAIEAGKHFVAANPETQATVGALLQARAEKAGVVYSDMDGDQPGIVQKLYEYVEGIGFEPVLAGNCKGVMKRYANPETQAAYSKANDIKPWIATAAADGTKLNIEMCIVANANHMRPAARGMTGVKTTPETLLRDLDAAGLLESGRKIVEYTLGIPVGVFVVGYSRDPWMKGEMQYFKMGDGPFYLFFSPHVLCQFDAVPSIAEAVLYRSAVIAPRGAPETEVVCFAKRELARGRRLDGIGGFDLYGQLVSAADALEQKLLPVGLAHCARIKKDVEKDRPLRMEDVEFVEENILTRLRAEQDRLFFGPGAGNHKASLSGGGTPAPSMQITA